MDAKTFVSILLMISFAVSTASLPWTAVASPTERPPAVLDVTRVKAIFNGTIPSGIESWAAVRDAAVVLRHEMLHLAAFRLGATVDSENFLAELRANFDVKWASYDGLAYAQHEPNDVR